MIASLPYAKIMVPFFCVISLVFLATTYDSASYALASSAAASLTHNHPPARWHRLLWVFMLALLPTVMLVGDSDMLVGNSEGGRLKSLQTASLLVSMPLIIIYVVMGFALAKSLREGEQNKIGQSEAG